MNNPIWTRILDRLSILALRLVPEPKDGLIFDLKDLQLLPCPSQGASRVFTLPDSVLSFVLALNTKTLRGNPAPVDGSPVWSLSDAGSDKPVLTAEPAGDGQSCKFTVTGNLGSVQIKAKVDPDLGPGVEELTVVETCEIVAGKAAVLGFSAPLEVTDFPPDTASV